MAEPAHETRDELQSELNNQPDPHELQRILDQVPNGVMAFDRNGTVTLWNRRLAQLTGILPADMLGRAVTDAFPGLALTTEEQSVTLLEQQITCRGAADESRIFDIHCTPMCDGEGRHIGFSASLHDVTERKRAEDARQQQVGRCQSILESITDGFFALDRDWNFTYINDIAAAMLRRPCATLLGRSIWEAFPDAVDSHFRRECRRVVEEQVCVTFQACLEPVDLWMEVLAYPLRDGLAVHVSDRSQRPRVTEVKEQHFQTLFENHPDAILSFDLRGHCVRFNKMLVEMSGYSEQDLQRGTLPLLLNKRDHRTLQRHLQQAAAGKPQEYEVQMNCKDGRILEIKVTNLPIFVNDQIVGVYGIFQDISERKQAEAELRATKDRLEAFLYNSADAIWMLDQNDLVMQVNPAFESLFGWSEQEVIGKRLPIIPAELSAAMEALHQAIKKGSSIIGFETQRICKDGRLLHVSATLSPVRDSSGRVVGVSGTCRDITLNKLAEEELRATKELFESIFNYTTDAVIVFDLEGQVVARNPAGERLADFKLQEDLVPINGRETYTELCNGSVPFLEFEITRTLEAGRQIDLQVTLSTIRNGTGQINAILLMAKDITESKKTQELLVQSEKLSIAGQLAAGVAHEIRNPLTALKGFVQLMNMGEGYQEKYLQVMASELERIEMIVSELLVLAKPQAMTFKRKPLAPILSDVLTLSSTQAILHNVEIVTEYAEGLPELECDDNQLKQVFINFIKNAIEAMPDGGTLRIQVQVEGGEQMRISFCDEGTGIAPEQLARLGEPFYTTKTKGTGLGLMVSKKIIEHHQGTLKISSQIGVGTAVEVCLPIPQG